MNFNIYSREEYFFDPLQEAILETTVEGIFNYIKKYKDLLFNIYIECGELLYQFLRTYHPYDMLCYGFVSYSHDYNLKNDEYKIKIYNSHNELIFVLHN